MERLNRAGRRGFTLIELLVVILIIGVVIAIIVPSLGRFRRGAKVAATRNLMMQLSTAASSFQTDTKRIPGYYSAKDMGSGENGTKIGMSAMHNALLDLTGGPTNVGFKNSDRSSRPLAPWSPLGARRDETAWVNPSTMGVGGSSATGAKAYFVPPAKHFVLPRPNRGTTEIARFGSLDANITDDSKRMPDLVDAHGTPLLWWGEDETVNGPFSVAGTPAKPAFAAIDSSKAAKWYWYSNAAYLAANSLGKLRTDQTTQSSEHSLLGSGVNQAELTATMAGLLGNPSYADGLTSATNADQVLPSGVRGKFVVHGADPEGYYLGNNTRGAKSMGKPAVVKFGYNYFLPPGTQRRLDDKNAPTSTDVITDFEDLIQTGGS